MAQVPISTEQLEELQNLVGKLSEDKAAADDATAESSAAHIALQVAQADIVTKDAAEAKLDAVVSEDVVKLQAFIGTLLSPLSPPMPPAKK